MREDAVQCVQQAKDAATMKRDKARQVLSKLDAESRELLKLVADSKNAKKEIRERTKCVRSLVTLVTTAEMMTLLTTRGGRAEAEDEEESLRTELVALREEVGRLRANQNRPGACDVCTQTERRERQAEATIEDVDGAMGEAPAGKARVVWTTQEEMKKRIGGREVEVGTTVSLTRTVGIIVDGSR